MGHWGSVQRSCPISVCSEVKLHSCGPRQQNLCVRGVSLIDVEGGTKRRRETHGSSGLQHHWISVSLIPAHTPPMAGSACVSPARFSAGLEEGRITAFRVTAVGEDGRIGLHAERFEREIVMHREAGHGER